MTSVPPDLKTTFDEALAQEPTPPVRCDLATIKQRGRRRRLRSRAIRSIGGLAAVVALGGTAFVVAQPGQKVTISAAASAVSTGAKPEEVAQAYLQARASGDRDDALTYWVPGRGTADSDDLDVENIAVSAPEPYSTAGTAAEGWAKAVIVVARWQYERASDANSSGPPTQWIILARNSSDDPWRIVSIGTAP